MCYWFVYWLLTSVQHWCSLSLSLHNPQSLRSHTSKHCSIHNFTIHCIFEQSNETWWSRSASISFWNRQRRHRMECERTRSDDRRRGQIMQIAKTHCEHHMRVMGNFRLWSKHNKERFMFIASMDHADYYRRHMVEWVLKCLSFLFFFFIIHCSMSIQYFLVMLNELQIEWNCQTDGVPDLGALMTMTEDTCDVSEET